MAKKKSLSTKSTLKTRTVRSSEALTADNYSYWRRGATKEMRGGLLTNKQFKMMSKSMQDAYLEAVEEYRHRPNMSRRKSTHDVVYNPLTHKYDKVPGAKTLKMTGTENAFASIIQKAGKKSKAGTASYSPDELGLVSIGFVKSMSGSYEWAKTAERNVSWIYSKEFYEVEHYILNGTFDITKCKSYHIDAIVDALRYGKLEPGDFDTFVLTDILTEYAELHHITLDPTKSLEAQIIDEFNLAKGPALDVAEALAREAKAPPASFRANAGSNKGKKKKVK